SGLLEQTAGFKIFSGGDLCNGFFQAPIDEASSRIMSWTTGTGSAAITQAFGEVLSPMSLPITTTVNGKTTTKMVCKQRVHLYIDDIFSEAEDLATMFTITEMILEKMIFLSGGGPQVTYLAPKNEDLEQQTGQNQPGVGPIQLRNQVDSRRK
ncbi:unnamed protein product, partial [Rotaria magnacalcarata]